MQQAETRTSQHEFRQVQGQVLRVQEQWLLGNIPNSLVLRVSLGNNQGYHKERATPQGVFATVCGSLRDDG